MSTVEGLDPIRILNDLADSCSRAEDRAFWILTSAAAYLNGHNMNDGDGSTVAAFFPGWANADSDFCPERCADQLLQASRSKR